MTRLIHHGLLVIEKPGCIKVALIFSVGKKKEKVTNWACSVLENILLTAISKKKQLMKFYSR